MKISKLAHSGILAFSISFLFIVISAGLISILPPLLNAGEKTLVSSQVEIPPNNSKVSGLQKYVIPPVSSGIQPPLFSARSILVKDLATDTILFQKNAGLSLPIASTTKIMTALVASEYFKPNSVLTIETAALAPGARIGLTKGESLTFRSLLYGMLLNSGNDAAFAIAENYPGGTNAFVEAMNKKAKDLSLNSTHFDNPAGFDSPSHFSSAADLAIIAEAALNYPDLARIFATKETQVLSIDRKQKHDLVNLNKLLSQVSGVLGVKTGYTDVAKENLVGLVDRGGNRVLTVILGSEDRFGETKSLVEWTYNNYIWQP